jgi:DNA-binding NarL/FixJ family response regulator
MIRVIVADDHHLVRQGIRVLLEQAEDIEVVGEAENGQQAIEWVKRLSPDVLVMDIAMPGMDGLQAAEHIRTLGVATRTVILSMYSDRTLVRRALRSGARGYLLKRSVTAELLLAVRAAARGEVYLSPEISATVVADLLVADAAESELQDQLTPRELLVLQLIAEGSTNKAIALTMQISAKTVEKHRANLMAKLHVNDIAGLVRVAIEKGLIFPRD